MQSSGGGQGIEFKKTKPLKSKLLMKGWIKLHRNIRQHWVAEKPERLFYFIDLLMEVSIADSAPDPVTKEVKYRRGECRHSLRWWAGRWKTGHKEVSRFLSKLQEFNIIRIGDVTTDGTLIKLSPEYMSYVMDGDLTVISSDTVTRQIIMPANQTQSLSLPAARELFEEFRQLYPGTKRSGEIEFINFIRKYPNDYATIIPLLKPAAEALIKHRKMLNNSNQFCPGCPMMRTWIKNARWTEEFAKYEHNSFRDGPILPIYKKVEKRERD